MSKKNHSKCRKCWGRGVVKVVDGLVGRKCLGESARLVTPCRSGFAPVGHYNYCRCISGRVREKIDQAEARIHARTG